MLLSNEIIVSQKKKKNLQIIKISNCEEQLKPTQVLAKILITTREKVTQIRRDKLCFKN